MGLLCPDFLPNTCLFLQNKVSIRFNLTTQPNQMMKFNNAYLPLFFFCWALLYSPLAVWYAYEQRENLHTVKTKAGHNRNTHLAADIDCFPCRYVLFSFTMGYHNKECPFADKNVPLLVFYKSSQCRVYGPN